MTPATRPITLRRDDTCAACGAAVAAGTRAIWDRAAKTVTCQECFSRPTQAALGTAGASARAEGERRRARWQEGVRARHPRIGGLLLALREEPTHVRNWTRGAEGEERVAAALARACGPRVTFLHDRRIPGSRANIDHIAVGPSGVTVIDPKRYAGPVRLRKSGGLLSPRREHLFVGGRDQTRLVDGMRRQIAVVEDALSDCRESMPVRGLLCFVDGELPLLGFSVNGIPICSVRKAAKLLTADGPADDETVRRVVEALAERLPAA